MRAEEGLGAKPSLAIKLSGKLTGGPKRAMMLARGSYGSPLWFGEREHSLAATIFLRDVVRG